MIDENFYLGLDIGTSSVGWAVTNSDYTIPKKSGKSLWGVRLFEEAETAAERRTNRSTRRRYGRKKWRLSLLKELFATEMAQTDPGFFYRMEESFFHPDDKLDVGKYSLFTEPEYTDKEYHEQYPTVFHLRHHLMISDENKDLRLLYLAVHHILKNRGHFLFENQEFELDNLLGEALKNFKEAYLNCIKSDDLLSDDPGWNLEEVERIITDSSTNLTEKKKLLKEQISAKDKDQKKFEQEWLNLLVRGEGQIKVLFPSFTDRVEDLSENTITISGTESDEIIDKYGEILTDEQLSLVLAAYKVFSAAALSGLLPEGTTLSEAKVLSYEKHRSDLALLKRLIKEYIPAEYHNVFRSEKVENNYVHYIRFNNSKAETTKLPRIKDPSGFYKYLKSVLRKLPEEKQNDPKVKQIYLDMENGNFLPKQRDTNNSYLPYQVHQVELEAILENAKKNFAFLTEVDEQGLSVCEKIMMLFHFRIPYYVGPLNDAHKQEGKKGFCWIVKKENIPVTPFNFDQIVDHAATAEAFIQRLTNTCTYLIGEDVLPGSSPLYEKYEVLSELNNLKINSEPIPLELKQKIFQQLFLQKDAEQIHPGRKITLKSLIYFLRSEGYPDIKADNISGIDQGFKSSMKTTLSLKKLTAEHPVTNSDLEKIVLALTVFKGSPELLIPRLRSITGPDYPEKLLKKIAKVQVGDWGRLSSKLLNGLQARHPENHEPVTLIEAMYETNYNFMQLLYNEFNFLEAINEYNKDFQPDESDFSYQNLIASLYASPAVKRSLWQTLLVAREIKKIVGKAPARIFIEMARGSTPDQKGKRTSSRKAQLQFLYRNCQDEVRNWDLTSPQAKLEEVTDEQLRSERLYLYLNQLGRCMYSGEVIDPENLFNTNLYDVDHIYPQSKVKDDSLNNKVLVKRNLNQHVKKDIYPVPSEIQNKPQVRKLWNLLLCKGFITKEKYNRLTRISPFSDDELAGFINRQLVETRQSTKLAASLLQKLFPESQIVYVKAGLVSDFRHTFDLVKVRELNDLHHAKDAYLNVVAGNVFYEKFQNNPRNFIKNEYKQGARYSMNPNTMFRKLDHIKNGNVIWKKEEKDESGEVNPDATIHTVVKFMQKNDILVSRKTYLRNGALFDQNPVSAQANLIPLKGNLYDSRLQNTQRYGGYARPKNTCFSLIEKDGKRFIVHIPLYITMKNNIRENNNLQTYIQSVHGESARVILPIIEIGSLVKINGCLLIMASQMRKKDITLRNASQLILSDCDEKYAKKIFKFDSRLSESPDLRVNEKFDGISADKNLHLYQVLYSKLSSGPMFLTPYSKYPLNASKGETLKKKEAEFIALSLEKQVRTLTQIIRFIQGTISVFKIDHLKQNATLYMSDLISKFESVILVHQSVTGFYTKEINLLNI